MWSHVLYTPFKDDVSVIQSCQFRLSLSGNLLKIVQLFSSFSQNPKLLQWRTVLTTLAICYVLDRSFYILTAKSYWHIDDRNTIDMLRIITRETKSKFQLIIGVFSIAFVMSLIEKFTEFLNTLTMKYELQNKCWINTCSDSIGASLSLLIILLPEFYYIPIRKIKLSCWNLDLKWHRRFSYKVAGNAVLSDHSTAGL